MIKDVGEIEKLAKKTKRNLYNKLRAGEIRITVGVNGLIDYCDQTLFLCKKIGKDKK